MWLLRILSVLSWRIRKRIFLFSCGHHCKGEIVSAAQRSKCESSCSPAGRHGKQLWGEVWEKMGS